MKSSNPFARFLQVESSGSVVLLIAATFALVLANSPLRGSYHELWGASVFGLPLLHWINDGLMSLFFFLVGLEIKRELVSGELASGQKALLPAVAALGGMLMPALIYSVLNWGSREIRGWAIPVATDIAFALGVLKLFGKRIPGSLRVFLTALAILDDIGAILVIAFFYTSAVHGFPLLLALAAVAVAFLIGRTPLGRIPVYFGLGLLGWIELKNAGIHPTLIGVLIAFAIPGSVGSLCEKALHPWISFGILPVFAFANAGVTIQGNASVFSPLSLGIILGLVFGKQIGIFFSAWSMDRLGLSKRPTGSGWGLIHGVACLGGIGFTMSLFIAGLAFSGSAQMESAKLSILLGSLISAILGASALAWRLR